MRRREFITLVGGATAWPFAALAQPKGVSRLGVLLYSDLKTTRSWQQSVVGSATWAMSRGEISSSKIDMQKANQTGFQFWQPNW